MVKGNPLEEKSKSFALRIVKAYVFLRDKKSETVMSKQLLRSGTSIGANIAEAQYAQSRADFGTKMSIALKEASETRYWIQLLVSSGFLSENQTTLSLVRECSELISLLVPTVRKTKKD